MGYIGTGWMDSIEGSDYGVDLGVGVRVRGRTVRRLGVAKDFGITTKSRTGLGLGMGLLRNEIPRMRLGSALGLGMGYVALLKG